MWADGALGVLVARGLQQHSPHAAMRALAGASGDRGALSARWAWIRRCGAAGGAWSPDLQGGANSGRSCSVLLAACGSSECMRPSAQFLVKWSSWTTRWTPGFWAAPHAEQLSSRALRKTRAGSPDSARDGHRLFAPLGMRAERRRCRRPPPANPPVSYPPCRRRRRCRPRAARNPKLPSTQKWGDLHALRRGWGGGR